jgi:hypothetical protein
MSIRAARMTRRMTGQMTRNFPTILIGHAQITILRLSAYLLGSIYAGALLPSRRGHGKGEGSKPKWDETFDVMENVDHG